MDNVFYRNLRKNYLEVDYGEGIYLYDTAGKKYIDACAGAAVANLGHAHPQVVQAWRRRPPRWRSATCPAGRRGPFRNWRI